MKLNDLLGVIMLAAARRGCRSEASRHPYDPIELADGEPTQRGEIRWLTK